MFIDGVVWIGAKLKRDQWHDKAFSIILRFLNNEISEVFVTDYIVLETVSFLLRKAGFDVVSETLKLFRTHERIHIKTSSFEFGFKARRTANKNGKKGDIELFA